MNAIVKILTNIIMSTIMTTHAPQKNMSTRCGCHHHHHHEEGGLKSKLFLIGATIILLIIAVFIEKNYDLATWQLLLVYLIPYLLIGHETLGEAAEGIAKGDMFNENFLMAIATIGALCIGFFMDQTQNFRRLSL